MVSARAWKNSDGEPRAGLNFNASNIKLHGGGRKAGTAQEAQSGKDSVQAENSKPDLKEPEEDLPF